MKLRSVIANNRKAQFELTTRAGKVYPLPFARVDPPPSADDPVREVYVDPELAREGFTWVLASGAEGSTHLDQALDYNQDPAYVAKMLTHRVTREAQQRMKSCGISRRALAARLGTSTAQLYRLLDPTNYSKSLTQMLALLRALDCDVDIRVSERTDR